jgi:hypothetical protein
MPHFVSPSATRPAFDPVEYLRALTPKLVTALREGYNSDSLRHDALAGLSVAILALPLSMAIAIGAGATPDKGLVTAVIGGLLISCLDGSRYQIGGPAAAFIVIIVSLVHTHGYDGMLTATFLAGFVLVAAGLLRLGTYIKYVPGPVILGFTSASRSLSRSVRSRIFSASKETFRPTFSKSSRRCGPSGTRSTLQRCSSASSRSWPSSWCAHDTPDGQPF